jgi:transposase
LIFQDEMEIHRHPALTRMWAPVAQQPEVPAPGKNEKQVVYGGVNYKTGKFTYTLSGSKCGAAFLVFLMVLVKAYVGQKIILVCDNGRFHKTAAVLEWLAAHRDQITVYWLPAYSPSLNLIERLWGHVKRTVLANVLYNNLDDLVAAFRQGVRHLTGNRQRMGFMFNHDDLTQEIQQSLRRLAA